jgi:ATP-dependent DNA helicase RecG
MTTVAVERALKAPTRRRGIEIARVHEDQWFERKSARVTAQALANTIVAFANAEGGVIVIGISDDQIEGVDRSPDRQNDWRQVAHDFTTPAVRMSVRLLDCVNQAGARDHLFVIEVQPSDQVHATVRDEVFLRVGDETRRLGFAQRQALEYDKGQTSYEQSTVRGAGLADLDDELMVSYARAVGHSEPRRLLAARGLVAQDGSATVGGLLLFGQEPQAHLPEAHVRIIRYQGSERGTGSRQRLLTDHRCEGPIPRVLFDASDQILALMPTRRALGSAGLFERIGLIPRDAWLEGLVNAVIHRSYSMTGDHVRVELFDDRIEIESPGRFPGGVDLSEPMSVARFARNPRIARVCADLNFGQELGEGIRRVFEEMRIAGLADPEYRQTTGSVRLTLRSAPFDRSLEERLPAHARSIARLIREAGRVSTGELVTSCGRSRPVVLRNLHALEEAGIVEWKGNSAQDPRAYWQLRIE